MTDRDLRKLYESAGRVPPSPHLDEHEWELLACGEMPEQERTEAHEHITACAECGRIFRALCDLESAARRFDPDVPQAGLWSASAGRGRAPFLAWGGLAAAAVFALWILVPAGRFQTGDRSPHEVEDQDLLRSGAESLRPRPLAPLGIQESTPESFSWVGVPTARAYRVEVLDANGEPLWTSPDVRDTVVAWLHSTPPEPGLYFWRVLALQSEPGEPMASKMVDFEVVR